MAVQTYRGIVALKDDAVALDEGTLLPPGAEVLMAAVAHVRARPGLPRALADAFRHPRAEYDELDAP